MTLNALARLREQVRCLERRSLSHSILRALPTGLLPVDDHLGGGLKTASLHDILVPDPLEIGASLALLLPLLARSGQPVFWQAKAIKPVSGHIYSNDGFRRHITLSFLCSWSRKRAAVNCSRR
ncbi:hypothetical protein [Gluconobacter sp.]|uniref:hypothetical protein n=1 Tax=Gluconobacter sp. TaxID=1876758 RepID=UPI0039EB532E